VAPFPSVSPFSSAEPPSTPSPGFAPVSRIPCPVPRFFRHSPLPLQPADSPRHRLPGRTGSPPDSELVLNAVKEGGRRVSAEGGYSALIPNPYSLLGGGKEKRYLARVKNSALRLLSTMWLVENANC
jgi:hypothetical protein